jgi:hypothetical protein
LLAYRMRRRHWDAVTKRDAFGASDAVVFSVHAVVIVRA